MYRHYDTSSGKHGTAHEEWAPHAAQTDITEEWWYITNILKDEAGNMIFQHLVLLHFAGAIYVQALGLDGNAGSHYLCSVALSDYARDVRILEETIGRNEKVYDADRNAIMFNANGVSVDWAFQGNTMVIKGKTSRYTFDLNLVDAKGILWHKDKLGIDGMIAEGAADQPSFYYSVPTLEVEGTVKYTGDDGKEIAHTVIGQGWCDRQWGDYMTKSWEWCSMRFFDGDRINLYAFPQTGHKVGTYWASDGAVVYFDNFTVVQKSLFETPNGIWLPNSWEYEIPLKGKKYRVKSLSEKDLLLFTNTLIESPGYLYNEKGEHVGYTANESMDIRITKTGPYANRF